MRREVLGRRAGAGAMGPDSGSRARGVTSGWPAWLAGLPGLVRRHLLFSVALGLSVVPRVITMLGFQPAILFKLDSYDYLWDAAHLRPNLVNPSGYSVFLWLLRPLHSLALVAGLQHALGLAVAMMVYATAGRLGVRAWIAARQLAPARQVARRRPQAALPHQDASWWLLSNLDSALVSAADGASTAWYQRDPRLFRSLTQRSLMLHARLLREWPRLSAAYRGAAAEFTSPERWRQTFAASLTSPPGGP